MKFLMRRPQRVSQTETANYYDCLLVTLGYEERSRAFAESYSGDASKRLAVGFTDRHELSYTTNRKLLEQKRYVIEVVDDADFRGWWGSQLTSLFQIASAGKVRLCVDISSLTRRRLAQILEGLCHVPGNLPLEVDFVYSIAEYGTPSASVEFAAVCGPVTPYFAGWPSDPDMPTAAIFGLGYETERALGAYEYLEPAKSFALLPTGNDARYDEKVAAANESLLRNIQGQDQFAYPVERPALALELLESLTFTLAATNRVILLPFGPKSFALSCMLTACLYYPRVGVWRVSPGVNEVAIQRRYSGQSVTVRVTFAAEGLGEQRATGSAGSLST